MFIIMSSRLTKPTSKSKQTVANSANPTIKESNDNLTKATSKKVQHNYHSIISYLW